MTEKPLKITLVSTQDGKGGAYIAAYRLYQGLRQLKQDAHMIVKNKSSNDPNIHEVSFKTHQDEIEKRIFNYIHKTEILRDRTELTNTWFSIPYPGCDISKTEIISHSEIINLHWMVDFQSTETIANLLSLGKPVVWTLHDESPYTGGCHYTAGCEGYQKDCKNCKQLKENRFHIPYNTLKNKIRLWNRYKNLTIVTPSKWLGERARGSRLFKNLRVDVIPNSLETGIYKPREKELAKKELGLDPRWTTLLVGAYSLDEKRKGFSKFLEAMKYCRQDKEFNQLVKKGDTRILTFGPPQEELKKLDIKIAPLGFVHDPAQLSTFYNAADIFVLPSLEDNLPNTMLEAMACATPVVGFHVGGLPDLIENGVTGYTAPCFDSKELGKSILKLVLHKDQRNQMGRNCRQLIEEKFKLHHQAENYIELFNHLLKNTKTTGKREKNREIVPGQWESVIQENFFEVYRKNALEILKIQHNQINHLNKLLKKREEKIQEIYGSYTHRIGSIILFPLKKINKFYREITGKNQRLPGKEQPRQQREMKIAIDVTPVLPGGDNGGIKLLLWELLKKFDRSPGSEEFILLTTEKNHYLFDEFNMKRICVSNRSSAPQALIITRIFNRLKRRLKRRSRKRILKKNGISVLFCPFAAPKFSETGISTVSVITDLQHVYYPFFFSKSELKHRNQFYERLRTSADYVIAISEYTRKTIIEKLNFSPGKVYVIPISIQSRLRPPPPASIQTVLEKYALYNKKYCIYPANLWPHKNHKMLITAFAMFLKKYPVYDLHLVLTGAPIGNNEILNDSIKQMGIDNRVHFTGFLPGEELAVIWSQAYFLIYPSLFEGFGIPLVEAMRYKKPILASNAASIPEAAGDAAIYFDPKRPDQIVNALQRIMEDTNLYDSLVKKGQEQLKKYDPDKMVDSYLQLLHKSSPGYG